MPNITLFIPDLFSHALASRDDEYQKLEALELLLARAQTTEREPLSYYRIICNLLDFQHDVEQDIPVAAVSRLLDAEERPEGHWLRADPVHLHADRDSLILFDIPTGSLNQHDALALAAELRESIRAEGWELEVPIASRWYIKYEPSTSIRTTELDQVIGRDIQNHLPCGDGAANWQRLVTEIQMQLHSSEVNELRQRNGELEVNSLWLWGSGELPEVFERTWSAVYSDDVFVKGLAMLSNTPCSSLHSEAESVLSENDVDSDVLVIINANSLSKTEASYEALERNWFVPLLQALREGKLSRLQLVTGKSSFELQKADLRKFWRRKKSIKQYLLV